MSDDMAERIIEHAVNRSELARILRTSLPTLDSLLHRHGEAFPVLRRGHKGAPYAFDPVLVIDFLRRVEQESSAAARARDELMQQYTLPELFSAEIENLTAGDRLKLAKVRQIERDLNISAQFLVETARVRSALATSAREIRRQFLPAIEKVLREVSIPEVTIAKILARLALAHGDFVAAAQKATRPRADKEGGPRLF